MQESLKNDLVEGLKNYNQKPIVKIDGYYTINCSHCNVLHLKQQTSSRTGIHVCYLCHGEFCTECSEQVVHKYKLLSSDTNKYLCASKNVEECWYRYKKYRDQGRKVFKVFNGKKDFMRYFKTTRQFHYDGNNPDYHDIPEADPWKYHINIINDKGENTQPGHVDMVAYEMGQINRDHHDTEVWGGSSGGNDNQFIAQVICDRCGSTHAGPCY